MRRILYIPIFLFVLNTLSAEEKPTILASCSMIADMCENIVGDLANVDMIVPVGSDPHIYEPTPSDASRVSDADIIFINGLTFEGWIEDLVKNAAGEAPVVVVTEGIEPIRSSKYDNSADPHAWMDLSLGQAYIKNIKDTLVSMFPDMANALDENYNRYSKEMKELDASILKEMLEIPETHRVLITSHDAFAYFGRRYHLQLEALMGISTESDARTSDMIRVIKIIKDQKVPAVFIESTINPKLLKQISEDTGAKIGGELFADSLGEEGSGAETYLGMLKHNANVIISALAHGESQETKIDQDSGGSNYLLYGALGFLLLAGLLFMMFRSKG